MKPAAKSTITASLPTRVSDTLSNTVRERATQVFGKLLKPVPFALARELGVGTSGYGVFFNIYNMSWSPDDIVKVTLANIHGSDRSVDVQITMGLGKKEVYEENVLIEAPSSDLIAMDTGNALYMFLETPQAVAAKKRNKSRSRSRK